MSTIVIEDAFRPEIYARSIVESTVPRETVEDASMPTWAKKVLAIIGLGILVIAVYPRIKEWLERDSPVNLEDELADL